MRTRLHPRPRVSAPRFLLALCLVLLAGCAGGGSADPYSKRYTAADINPNPHILNSAIVKGTDLTGLRLENVVIRDATLLTVTARNAFFKNVVFDNCRLINAVFDGAIFDNVTFRGGIITCEGDPYNFARRSRFTNSRFANLIFDGTYLENPVFSGVNGSITIRNAHQVAAIHPMITGSAMRLVLQNSVFRHATIADVTGESSLTATNCTFIHAHFGGSTFSRVSLAGNVAHGNIPLPRRTR